MFVVVKEENLLEMENNSSQLQGSRMKEEIGKRCANRFFSCLGFTESVSCCGLSASGLR